MVITDYMLDTIKEFFAASLNESTYSSGSYVLELDDSNGSRLGVGEWIIIFIC